MPKTTMQRLILRSIILIFAATGIACACPGDSNAAATNPHQLHGEIQHGDHDVADAGPQANLDCCDDCTQLNAFVHDSGSALAIEIRSQLEDPEFDPLESGSLAASFRFEPRIAEPHPHFRYRDHPSNT
ncbi:MAG: hypothetical protein ACR2Q3_14220, partial [Woeseiaceae bacterium]